MIALCFASLQIEHKIDQNNALGMCTKKNSKDYKVSWTGYKLHIDVADGGIPISAVLTSASTHDSQVAIPLAKMSRARVIKLYDIMDSAYDVPQIHDMSRQLGHIPLIDMHPRRDQALKNEMTAENKRCRRVVIKPPKPYAITSAVPLNGLMRV